MFVKHPRGKPISKDKKEVCLNIFQYYIDKGREKLHAMKKASKIGGISLNSMKKIVNEKLATGSVRDNNRKFRNKKNMFEKLSEQQKNRIRVLVHEMFEMFIKRPGKQMNVEASYPTLESVHEKIQGIVPI